MAYRGSPETKEAFIGALMEAEFQAAVIWLARGWFKAHTKTGS
jgi:hypothetical protein